MSKRKTKGSSMLLTIAIFGILSIVGTSMLAATTASYKLRITESNRIKNLYGAESGLDMAYIEMNKVIQEAINSGINNVPKSGDTSELQNSTFKKEYVKYVNANLKSRIENLTYTITTGEAKVLCNISDKDGVDYDILDSVKVGDKSVELKSTFTDVDGKQRTVSVVYTLEVPDGYIVESTTGDRVSKLIKYSIASDENLEVASSNDLDVRGNVWIQGTMPNGRNGSTVNIDEKYAGGIVVDDSNIIFRGNVATASNIKIEKGTIAFDGEVKDGTPSEQTIYSENIFLGDELNSEIEGGIVFNGKYADLYVANDLVINSSDAEVEINKYYGFNDVNTKDKIQQVAYDSKAIRGSSSIIINSQKWPSVKGSLIINTEAYIMGSAYIKTTTPYQTGESIALKGNYKAYTEPVKTDKYDSTGYTYSYLDPLVLISKDTADEPLSLEEKAEHFLQYATSQGVNNQDAVKDAILRTSGISLPTKTYSVGAYVSGGKVNGKSSILEAETEKANNMKKAFAQAVYNMEDTTEEVSFDDGHAKATVSNEINWDGVKKLIGKELGNKAIRLDDTTVILNNSENDAIVIDGNTIKINGEVLATIDKSNNTRYIVVTKGIVEYVSKESFNGAIFSTGTINIENAKSILGLENQITKEELTKEENKGVLDLIFTLGNRTNEVVNINATSLISKEKWKLEK